MEFGVPSLPDRTPDWDFAHRFCARKLRKNQIFGMSTGKGTVSRVDSEDGVYYLVNAKGTEEPWYIDSKYELQLGPSILGVVIREIS